MQNKPQAVDLNQVAGINKELLERELDKTKARVFINRKIAAFFGPLMTSMKVIWTEDVPRAATDYENLMFNPTWFMSITNEIRDFVMMHELQHPARLHNVRRGTRDPKLWNIATDIRINNDLHSEGYRWGNEDTCFDPSVDVGGRKSEEEIYKLLETNAIKLPPGFDVDLFDPDTPQNVLRNVVQSVQAAKRANQAGTIPGHVELTIERFLSPILPWETLLNRFFEDLQEEDYSWQRPNRRYLCHDIYAPSRVEVGGRLQHLMYFLDVSGSISDNDIMRFNSEVKHIKEKFNPVKLTLVQFDTRITAVDEFTENDEFKSIQIKGRGGTSLYPVKEYIDEHKPTAAVIFSDLFCPSMPELERPIPVIWVVCNHPGASVPFGTKIHINN